MTSSEVSATIRVPHLSWSHIDAGGIGMAVTSLRAVAVVDWLTLVSILPPSSQTLTGVRPWACLYAFSLQGAEHSSRGSEGAGNTAAIVVGVQYIKLLETCVQTAAASERWSTRV